MSSRKTAGWGPAAKDQGNSIEVTISMSTLLHSDGAAAATVNDSWRLEFNASAGPFR